MHRQTSSRRRSSYSLQVCVAVAVFLLVVSLSVLHIRLSSSPTVFAFPFRSSPSSSNLSTYTKFNTFFDDADNDAFDGGADDRIDELDDLEEEKKLAATTDDADTEDTESSSGIFWDHAFGVARISFGRPNLRSPPSDDLPPDDLDQSKVAFGSDDEPVDSGIRDKLASIRRIEDALLLKMGADGDRSPMREGWARWLEGKGDFLRRDRMLRSNLELLNTKNHPLLQDPDDNGITMLTRGDRLMKKLILMEMEKEGLTSFGTKRMDGRRKLHLKEEGKEKKEKRQVEEASERRWGHFPGLSSSLGFSEFMDQFLGGFDCSLQVFMVWNSPSWGFGVRQQRALESVLHHHRNACVVVFSETMELDFFSDFTKDGFKIAVVMPNLDEMLKDTPAHMLSSVWFEWRKTKHYALHYSELVRLAALYKFGGVYLDFDVIILKPLYSLKNSVGLEEQRNGHSTITGAVMAFDSHSPFLMDCLKEFYSTYDDTLLRWNGADLITRVIERLLGKGDDSLQKLGIKIQPRMAFYPISSADVVRYFSVASGKSEKELQESLLTRVLHESYTFHFWNGLTQALVPEPNSLAERLINHFCLRCIDVL
ncbi:Uncharacterized protein AXF42_Ash003942 [Apostasia shenzhenica]|uniref:Alpha 1,4-glycosyltransferase domain-containing protein n=1 Tax=Apostasia shenzhenica TaxID=1088818 RepID=A0A2I0AIE6_9ASPA|nr:Uncharacterized protein AXF42_Ash003942 [Apostasia shenzhenica]